MRQLISRILQFGGFLAMIIGIFTSCKILTAGVIAYLVGFVIYLTFAKLPNDSN